MTLTQLRYVITIADTGSMNEASKALFISQPSLSQAVKELETEIGVELFKRSNRGVSVTQEGIEFLGYARQVVEQYELIESHYIERKNVKKKFGVSMQHYTFAVNAFVEMVRQFGMDEYEFAVRETKTYEVIEDVKEFRSEIGIIYINDFNQKVLTKMIKESDLEFHPILDCGVYVYLWKGHPLQNRTNYNSPAQMQDTGILPVLLWKSLPYLQEDALSKDKHRHHSPKLDEIPDQTVWHG